MSYDKFSLNRKTRTAYSMGNSGGPKCFTLSSKCKNYGLRCIDCYCIQGKYTLYEPKKET